MPPETDKKDIIRRFAAEEGDETLLSRALDRARRFASAGSAGYFGFLSPRECMMTANMLRSAGYAHSLYGGHENFERGMVLFLPDYLDGYDENALETAGALPYSALAILPKGSDSPSHRDILGAALALGITREKLGDIVIGESAAYMVVFRDIEAYITDNLDRVGKIPVEARPCLLRDIEKREGGYTLITETVMSPRADAVCAAAFCLPRERAKQIIQSGRLNVNWAVVPSPDAHISEGDVLSIKGLGRAQLCEISGKSRKGRTFIVIKKFT